MNIRNLKENDLESFEGIGPKNENNPYDGEQYYYKDAEAFIVWNPNQIKSATENNGDFSTTDDHIQAAFAGSQLDFAHGVRKPEGKDVYLLSSAIMTQANTFEHFTEGLKDNTGSIVKRVILFGNNAYLWSTENGHEFFIEQSLTINEKNYDKINNLLSSYGTDEFTTTAINSIQRSKDKKARSRSLAEFAKRERSGENS